MSAGGPGDCFIVRAAEGPASGSFNFCSFGPCLSTRSPSSEPRNTLYVTHTTLCLPLATQPFPFLSSRRENHHPGGLARSDFPRLIPWAHGLRGGGLGELRLKGSCGRLCGIQALAGRKKAPQWPRIAFSRGPTTPSTPGFLSPPSVVGSLPAGEGLPPLPEGRRELPTRRTSPPPAASEVHRIGFQSWKWTSQGRRSNSEGGLVGGEQGTGSPCDSLR